MILEPFTNHKNTDNFCQVGTPVKCNTVIRLQHVDTHKFLHSHSIPSALSGQQEISAFGSDKDKTDVTDEGDNWKVECVDGNGNSAGYWERNQRIQLKHIVTKKYLSTSTSFKYTDHNCPHCPIVGHLEAFAREGSSVSNIGNTFFRAEDGVHLFH